MNIIAPEFVPDEVWFRRFPKRLTRIRETKPNEFEEEFKSLGPHLKSRRRILVARVPDGRRKGMLMPISFLLFSDENIENEDSILLPILRDIMNNEWKQLL